jgi:fructosamine-3-kinase
VSPELADRIEALLGDRPVAEQALSGGCIAAVSRLEFARRDPVVVKRGGGSLALEGWMLTTLKERSALPVPDVLYAEDDLLILSHLPGGGGLDASAQTHAADLIAALHGVTGTAFGLERDTLIGSLHQPNPETPRWLDFFRDHRLLYMAGVALQAGRLPPAAMIKIEGVAARLSGWIDEPRSPALVHGDLWGGNVLAKDGRITGFIDPAIYYADPEIELAFSTLFNTFGDSFFARYADHRPLAPGFFELRRDLYNLYPLLVHVRLFGGGYLGQVEAILRRLV